MSATPIRLTFDPSSFRGDLDATMAAVEEALEVRTQYLNHLFAERVRQNLGGEVLQTRSGRLLGTVLESGPINTGSSIDASVQAGGDEAPYGQVHEDGGQREYMIYPKNGRALAFELDGRLQFFASVRHPPLPKRAWFGPVEEEMAAIWGDELQKAASEVLR